MKSLAGLLLICLSLPAAAATYRWVDANGQVHYSDRPRENAEKVEISGAQTYTPTGRARPQAASRGTGSEDEAQPIYQSLRVVRPAPQETYRNIAGRLPVTLSLTPSLSPGHSLQVFYDGRPVVSWPARQLSFTLTDVYRGEHNLRAVVVDIDGKQLASSETVTFYVHQTSLFNRARN